MIIYDFSLHLFEWLWGYNFTKLKHPFYVGDLFDHLSKGNQSKRQKIYQTFWVLYWGLAALLLILYLMLR